MDLRPTLTLYLHLIITAKTLTLNKATFVSTGVRTWTHLFGGHDSSYYSCILSTCDQHLFSFSSMLQSVKGEKLGITFSRLPFYKDSQYDLVSSNDGFWRLAQRLGRYRLFPTMVLVNVWVLVDLSFCEAWTLLSTVWALWGYETAVTLLEISCNFPDLGQLLPELKA